MDQQPYLDRLRGVTAEPEDQDIVTLGWIDAIERDGQSLVIRLDAQCADHPQVSEIAVKMREALEAADDTDTVRVTHAWQSDQKPRQLARPHSPLQAELIAEGILPEPDPMGAAMTRPDIARETGYREEGPRPLDGPGGTSGEDAGAPAYRGSLPVFQWEVDPEDTERTSGDALVEADGWEYRLWWQIHPEQLVYVSIQALGADQASHQGRARRHAVGRAVVVNLVYDLRREGVVAVYGTTRDFRPFIEAFQEGFDGPLTVDESSGQPSKE